MKLLVVALSCLVAAVVAEEPILRFYHENEGIRRAEEIRQAEMAIDFDGARIVGGSQAALGAYPYLGGLLVTLTSGATSVCGSSLLSPSRLLSAAHCWFDGRNQGRLITVVLGSIQLYFGGTRITSSNVAMHENYNFNTLNNDIAIISISSVSTSNIINTIALPSNQLNNNFAGVSAWAAGFGRTSDSSGITTSQVLSHVQLQVITNAVCQQTYGSTTIIASTLCTAGVINRGTCSGDSGGPLVTNNLLIGVVSFVAARGCQAGLPAGFARTTSFDSWIRARL